MIKDVELITNEIQYFSLKKIKLITGFADSFYKKLGESKSLLKIDLIIEDDNGYRFLAKFHFHNPENLRFESSGSYHQISIDIQDIKNKGWENKRHEVIDFEEGNHNFYCSDIEVFSIISYKLVVLKGGFS